MANDVELNDRRAKYTATADQTVFDIDFPITETRDVAVYLNGAEVDAADYVVDVDGLTVTLNTGASLDDSVVVDGDTDPIRTNSFPRGGDLRTSILNGDFKRIFYILQELLRNTSNRISLNPAEASNVSPVLPLNSDGAVLAWGPDGIENGPTTSEITTAAASSATAATAAVTSATASAASATAASVSETAAAASETAAATSETNAGNSAAAASASETAAATSETNAGDSETAAAGSATAAASSATAANASETAASASETASAISETNASNSASAAVVSATAAATSETNAGDSEAAAAASEALAEDWANKDEDVVVSGGEFSAKHYAAKAAAFASGSAAAISYDPSGSPLSDTNVQDAIDSLSIDLVDRLGDISGEADQNDFLMFYDVSDTAQKKISFRNLFATINDVSNFNQAPAADDKIAIVNVSNGNSNAAVYSDFMNFVNLTEDASPNISADYVLGLDVSSNEPVKIPLDTIGLGNSNQSWSNVTGSRALSTNYTNSTGQTILVAVSLGGNASHNIIVDGTTYITFTDSAGNAEAMSFFVPNGSTYQVTAGTIVSWSEWR